MILHRQLDEEIIEDCQDVDSNKGEDEYDSDESELDPQDDSDNHVFNRYSRTNQRGFLSDWLQVKIWQSSQV